MGVRWWVATAVGWGVLVSGCSGSDVVVEPSAAVTPTAIGSSTSTASGTSSSPTSSSSTSPTKTPSLPAAARVHSSAGAEAFVRHYLAQVNRAWMTPDAAVLQGLASSSCKTCANFAMTARSLQRDKLHYEGAPATISVSIVLPESTPDLVAIQLVYIQNKVRIVDVNGRVDEQLKRIPGLSEVTVTWASHGWIILGIKVVNPS